MKTLWVGIDPHPTETRILAMSGPSETVLKARLRPHPQHPRAAATLLEALSLWQGAPARAALCADESPPLFDTGSWIDALLLAQGAPLYEVTLVPRRRRRRRDGLGLGDMREFLDGGRNIVLVAPQGLGKTMLARNIANQAVLAGHSLLFVTAARLLLDLAAQDSARTLERRFRHYCRPTLLCIDEIGYLSYDARNADLLFQIISRRYEHKSIVMTTNLAFSEWPTIFPNATCATALIDRTVRGAAGGRR